MAPMLTTPASPQKRPLSMADYNAHPAKKQRQFYHRHHTLQFKQQSLPGVEPGLIRQLPILDQEDGEVLKRGPKPVGRSQIEDLLDYSIVSICDEVAAREGIMNSSIDAWALEIFRGCVEEYVLNLCKYIRRPMLAARRTAPIATDFESAFQAAQVPTPEDQLPPQVTPKPPAPLSLLPTPPPDDFFKIYELPDSIPGPDVNAKEEKQRNLYIPSTFPAFPSQHTFRDTAVLPPRERDPRRIRELATEEGRLGEQALRKLAGAVRGEGKLDLSVEADIATAEPQRVGQPKKAETMEGMFEETMKELAKREKGGGNGDDREGEGFEVAPIVNSERKFWMPDTSRRKSVRVEPPQSTAKAGGHHHSISEKARGKQKMSDMLAGPAGNDLEMEPP